MKIIEITNVDFPRRPSAEGLFTSRLDATIGPKLTERERARRRDQQVH